MTPHMHLLGRTMHVTATTPDGQSSCLADDPPKAVGWGENTTDEMCIGFLNFTLDVENLTSGVAVSPERAGQLDAVEPFLQDLWSQLDPAPLRAARR